MIRSLPAAALLLATASAAHTQPSPSSALGANQQRALATVRAAAAALGGDAVVTGMTRLEVVQSDTLRSGVQAPRPGDTVAVPVYIRTVVDFARGRVMRETDQRYPGGYRFNFRNTFAADGGVSYDVLRNRGGIEHGRNTPQQSAATLASVARVLPAGYLRQALQNPGSLRHLGEAHDGGEAVSYADGTGVVFTLLFDGEHRLTAAERLLPQGPALALYRVEFDGYRAFGPMLAPERIVVRVNGVVSQTTRVNRVEVDPALPEELFALPAGYVEAPPAGPPRAERVADGVWALRGMPGAYHAMFVEMDDHVVVLEAPQSAAHAETALRLIGEAVPGKPVRYVLVTHHHGDHIAGAGPYAAAGATFVAAPGVEPAIRAVIGAAGAQAKFETVSRRRTFGTGARRIDVLPAPGVHAESMLMFHLPALGLVFQGDLLSLAVGPLPQAIPVNRDFAAALRRHRVDASTIVGVHGRTATMQELRQIVAGPDAPWTVAGGN
jgi:glyoxylase-like metal-dependent hydrolase (beta-lactamase superfamily II)